MESQIPVHKYRLYCLIQYEWKGNQDIHKKQHPLFLLGDIYFFVFFLICSSVYLKSVQLVSESLGEWSYIKALNLNSVSNPRLLPERSGFSYYFLIFLGYKFVSLISIQ